MTTEIESDPRISKLEDRVHRLEKIILDNEDIFHKNFDGYENVTPEEEELINEALRELESNVAKSIDDVLNKLE